MSEGAATRIDRWLWVARVFKTRSLATAACAGGHVTVDGQSAKASKLVRPGVEVEVRTAAGLRILEVVAVVERRGPASEAKKLYVDHSPPPPPREIVPQVATRERGLGRPSKRERRLIDKLRGV